MAGLVLLVVIAGSALVALSGGGSSPPGAVEQHVRTLLVAHEAKPLPTPISGESVVPTRQGPLIIGGLDASESSAGGVFQLEPNDGELKEAGSLTTPLHDTGATVLGDRVFVFGGGAETSTDTVQSLPLPDVATSAASAASAEVTGKLPTVRSDLSAVTVGERAYVLGGYDGTTPIESILATSDGSSFEEIGRLPDPARYLAVATLGGKIFAFGGETESGSASEAVREIDPQSGSARIVGHLPGPVSHAAAATLDGSIYVLGGEAEGSPTARIWRFDPSKKTVSAAGRLPEPVSGGGVAVIGSAAYLIGGTGSGEAPLSSVTKLEVRHQKVKPSPKVTASTQPFEGRLMIADRGNDRIIVVNAQKHVLWRFPSKAHPAPPGGFYFPDDAFFIHGGKGIISNEEQNQRIVQLSYPAGKLLWSYGHAGEAGSEPGYLHEPDDAYLLKNGDVSVADADNCRVLLISPAKKVLRKFGNPESCTHEPPDALGEPNGDTPLENGDILVSEVTGSHIDEITPAGKLVWSLQLPIAYPSDPQQLGPDRYLVADYTKPGGIYEFNREGKILWSYGPTHGEGMLNHPSLAERLPSGLIAANDDYRDRVVIIDPKTRKIVWQYGTTGEPGTGPDHLRIPDGFDLLAPDGTTPTHPFTG